MFTINLSKEEATTLQRLLRDTADIYKESANGYEMSEEDQQANRAEQDLLRRVADMLNQ